MRSSIVSVALIVLVSSLLPAMNSAGADNYDYATVHSRIRRACEFLITRLYNPGLGLVRETFGSSTYWIASDNLLVAKALDSCSTVTSKSINMSIQSCCGSGYDRMHEAAAAARIDLPIHNATTITVANSTAGKYFRNIDPHQAGDYTVLWEYHNGTGILSDRQYGDVAAYTALELEHRGNHTAAVNEIYTVLNRMYDGRGIYDEPYKNGPEIGRFQTFKDALYILALAETDTGDRILPTLVQNLLTMQAPDGGFYTAHGDHQPYLGSLENAETTSLAIIALETVPPNIKILDTQYNLSGDGLIRTLRLNITVSNAENTTVTFKVRAHWYWGDTVFSPVIVENLPPQALKTVSMKGNVNWNPCWWNGVTVDAGNSTTYVQVQGLPYNGPPIECRGHPVPDSSAWSLLYWSLFSFPVIPVLAIATTISIFYLLGKKRGQDRTGKEQTWSGD